MKIGIAGPIEINSLQQHLYLESEEQLSLGLGGTSVNNLVNSMLRRGLDVSVYSLDASIQDTLVLSGPKLKVYLGHYRTSHRARAMDFFRKESSQIKNFIKMDSPSIVHAHWSYEFAIGAIQSKIPHLVTFRDSAWDILKLHRDSFRLVRYLIDLWVKRNGKHFTVNSPYLQEQLSYFKKNLPIIPNSINENFIGKPKTYPSQKIRIISLLNGWTDRKNPKTALMAFKMLYDKYGEKVEYHLYGPGYDIFKNERGWCVENGYQKGVKFCGEIHHSKLMSMIKEYDILLHPAIEESFGNTLLEGMASGLPIVAGEKAGAVPWVLNYGKNGILVDVSAAESIFEGLDKIILDKSLYQRLSLEGIECIKSKFTSDEILNQYLDFYNKILNKK